MTDTLYTIPQNWRWTTLENVCKLIGGGTPNKKIVEYWNGNIFWASVKDIKGDYLFETVDKITEQGLENSSTNLCEIDDLILITRIEPAKTIIAKVVTAINQDLKIVKSPLPPKFLHYFFQNFKSQIELLSSGTTVKGITIEKLNNFPIPVPPLAEQKRIVERLDSLFAKLDAAKKILQDIVDGYEQRRAAILHRAFTGELTEDFRKKNNLSLDDWQEKTLDKFIQLLSGQDLKSDKYNSLKNGIPYITGASNFDGEKILINRWTEKPTVISKKGDVLITCKGSTGKTAMANFESAHIARQVMALRVSEKAYNFFVHYFLQSKYEELKKCERGLIPGISRQDILNLEINLPPLEEQKEISRRLNSLIGKENQTKEIAENLLSEIEKLKKTILSRAFRGELGTNSLAENAVENFI